METNKHFDIEYTKRALNEFMEQGNEPELCIKLDGNDYMIIPLKDKISFQQIGVTEETYYRNIEELFSSILVNNIILDEDWNRIEDIWFY